MAAGTCTTRGASVQVRNQPHTRQQHFDSMQTCGNTSFTTSDFTLLQFRNFFSNRFFGKTKCVAVFKEAITDAELTCLTTI